MVVALMAPLLSAVVVELIDRPGRLPLVAEPVAPPIAPPVVVPPPGVVPPPPVLPPPLELTPLRGVPGVVAGRSVLSRAALRPGTPLLFRLLLVPLLVRLPLVPLLVSGPSGLVPGDGLELVGLGRPNSAGGGARMVVGGGLA